MHASLLYTAVLVAAFILNAYLFLLASVPLLMRFCEEMWICLKVWSRLSFCLAFLQFCFYFWTFWIRMVL